MSAIKSDFDVLRSIHKHISQLKPWFPKLAVIGIGEYIADIISKGAIISEEGVHILIGRPSGGMLELNRSFAGALDVLDIEENYLQSFWFDVFPKIMKDDVFVKKLKNRSLHMVRNALILSTTWDGIGSGFLPAITSQFKSWNVKSMAVAILPSKVQPSAAHFNALTSVGLCTHRGATPMLLMNRDSLENYVGVDRKGLIVKGKDAINILVELMLNKGTFFDEIEMLSKSFDVKLYAVLFSTGASLRIYGSLYNILRTTLFRPLLDSDLSTATVAYAISRIPLQLKDKLSKEQVEFAIADWLKEVSSLRSIQVSDPLIVDDVGDRIDIAVFIGGFETAKTFSFIEKKGSKLKDDAIKRGILSDDEWQDIIKNLV